MQAPYLQHQETTEIQSPAAGRRCEIHQEKKVIFEFTQKILTVENGYNSTIFLISSLWFKVEDIHNTNQTLKTLITPSIKEGFRKRKNVFFMVFCQTGGRGVSEGSEKTILLF